MSQKIIDQTTSHETLEASSRTAKVIPEYKNSTSSIGEHSDLEVVVRRTIGKNLLVSAYVEDLPVNAVIDTAAMVTLVNEKLLPRLSTSRSTMSVTLKGLG